MTWQDAIDLAKRVTRSDNDVLYRGLDVIGSNLMSFPFALSFIDGKTNKASMNNDKWKTVFELTKQIETIPGNEPPTPEGSTSKEAGYFIKDDASRAQPDEIFQRRYELDELGHCSIPKL